MLVFDNVLHASSPTIADAPSFLGPPRGSLIIPRRGGGHPIFGPVTPVRDALHGVELTLAAVAERLGVQT